MNFKKLSVIVPVYKGEKYIRNNLEVIKRALDNYFPRYEIIVVVDGLVDKTYEEACRVKDVKVLTYKKNQGKGFALKYGFKYAIGDIIAFIDADMDFHPALIKNFLPYLITADIIIGSKRHPFSRLDYPMTRKVLSKGYQIFSWFVLGINVKDTQSGLKIIKKEVLDIIMPLLTVKKYAFDVEMCFLAQKHSLKIVEVPISIKFHKYCSGINWVAVLSMFIDTLAIRYRYSIGHYYQKRYAKIHFLND